MSANYARPEGRPRVRERLFHCHMLFHLAHPFFRGRKHNQIVRALERLIDRHGEGNYADYTLKLTYPRNPNGAYLLKGGGPDVWRLFGVGGHSRIDTGSGGPSTRLGTLWPTG
jgi:hypothetical protein